MANQLKNQEGLLRWGTGVVIQPLCVVEELDPNNQVSAEAVVVFGGFSLCLEHFEKVTDLIKAGVPMGLVVAQMMKEGLD